MRAPRLLLCLALLCLDLASCAPPDIRAVSDGPAPDTASCGAAGLAAYKGQPVATLPVKGAWHSLRVIQPGMMITMDYSATRLNARVDGAGRILTLTCG